jgi:hypothetical protein
VGIDRHPIPVDDEEAARWLLACVWPEHLARFARLRAAIEVARGDPPNVIAGDIVETLPSARATVPEDKRQPRVPPTRSLAALVVTAHPPIRLRGTLQR